KVNISIVLLCQSANVEDLGLSGPMRQNFTRIALDDRTAKQMIGQDESDPDRRKALFAALVGRSFPAVAVCDGQVHILDRTGLDDYPRPVNARRYAWEPVPRSAVPQSADNGRPSHLAEQRNGTEQRDALARALFRKGHTVRTVADTVRRYGFTIENDR